MRTNGRKDPWWHVVGLSSGLLYAAMLFMARLHLSVLTNIDMQVQHVIAPYQTLPITEFFLAVTVLGSPIGVTIISLGLVYLLHQHYPATLRLFLVLLLTGVSMVLSKDFVERLRPDPLLWIERLSTFSFPSGHAALSTALYSTLAVLGYRHARTAFGRACMIGGSLLILILVSLSRIVLSVHYFTDVVAGMLLGVFWLSVVFIVPHHSLSPGKKGT